MCLGHGARGEISMTGGGVRVRGACGDCGDGDTAERRGGGRGDGIE